METGKFSPKQQPEGPILHELDIASEEQTSCLDSRVQTSSVTQPWCICMCEEEAACSGLWRASSRLEHLHTCICNGGSGPCMATLHKLTHLPHPQQLPHSWALPWASTPQTLHTFSVRKCNAGADKETSQNSSPLSLTLLLFALTFHMAAHYPTHYSTTGSHKPPPFLSWTRIRKLSTHRGRISVWCFWDWRFCLWSMHHSPLQ